MGFFSKLFGALKKTKDNVSEKLRVLFSKNKLGDEFYEELEEIYSIVYLANNQHLGHLLEISL